MFLHSGENNNYILYAVTKQKSTVFSVQNVNFTEDVTLRTYLAVFFFLYQADFFPLSFQVI